MQKTLFSGKLSELLIRHYFHMYIYISMLAICLAYLLGSLSSAVIFCKLLQLPDPRTKGSHNPGATNVYRFGGKKAAILTLFGDVLKGFFPVYLGECLSLDSLSLALIAFAAFLGHLYPIFFRFEGGKGVATAFGTLLALSPLAALGWFITWLLLLLSFKMVSLASVLAAVTAPLFLYFFTRDYYLTISMTGMMVLLILRHQMNIKKMLNGKERHIKLSK